MRIGNLTINGVDYPIIFSTAVAIALEDKTGKSASEGLTEIFQKAQLKDLFWLIAEMIRAGCNYKRLMGEPHPDPISFEDLATLTAISDYGDLFAGAMEVATNGVRPEVIVEPESKNLQASPDD